MGKNILIIVLFIALSYLGYQYVQTQRTRPVTQPTEQVEKKSGELCAQVITPARDPNTGTITEFPTPCDVPDGWERIENDVPGLDLEVQ